ncbi:hypothetical protein MPL3356_340012 [Mesorhizobium plurifarium]|uniref:Uncharacterized protein n=1 Tax=Mesorhizobium plurifarium TaxID=69974 RepID=A0A090DUZ2_MESPL|nr:hypothetical protein MPL3356_340012 [Mesorhizobium plurifarium]
MNFSQPDIDPIDLSVQGIKLSDESIQREGRIIGQVCSYLIQLRNEGIDPVYSLRDNDPILGQVRPERTRRHGSLPNQKASGSVQHQESLIFSRFDRNKAHVGSGHCFTNCRRISGVILRAATHERFNVAWRNQASWPSPCN